MRVDDRYCESCEFYQISRQDCQLRLFKSRFRLFLNDLDLEISYLDYGLYLRLFYDVG